MGRYDFNKRQFDQALVSDIIARKKEDIAEDQLGVLDKTYISRTGHTRNTLLSIIHNGRVNNGGFSITYPDTILFLDLKYSGRNDIRKKSVYSPIFKRYIYGHVFGGKNLKRGYRSFTSLINNAINNQFYQIIKNQTHE